MFSQTFINLKHIQRLELLYEFDVRYHTKVGKFNLSSLISWLYNTRIGGCFFFHRQQTRYWTFTQTKLSSIYRHKSIVTYQALLKRQAFLSNLGETQTWYYFFLLFGRKDSVEIVASVGQEEENVEVLKRCHIEIYPTRFLPCDGKAVNLQHTCNLEWSNLKNLLSDIKRGIT